MCSGASFRSRCKGRGGGGATILQEDAYSPFVNKYCNVGPIDDDEEHIRDLNVEHLQCSGVIAKSDEAMRSAHWDRLRRKTDDEI